VTLVCDTGSKYLTKMFNDFWLAAHGFDGRELHGDLRDLIAKRYADGGVVAIGSDDTLLTAYNRMRSSTSASCRWSTTASWSAFSTKATSWPPSRAATRRPALQDPGRGAMTRAVNTLQSHQSSTICPRSSTATRWRWSVDGEEFVGVITRVDLINHLRMAS
jgi:cystathionine beta-synthase